MSALNILENSSGSIIGGILFSKVAVVQCVTFLIEEIRHKYFPGYLPV